MYMLCAMMPYAIVDTAMCGRYHFLLMYCIAGMHPVIFIAAREIEGDRGREAPPPLVYNTKEG